MLEVETEPLPVAEVLRSALTRIPAMGIWESCYCGSSLTRIPAAGRSPVSTVSIMMSRCCGASHHCGYRDQVPVGKSVVSTVIIASVAAVPTLTACTYDHHATPTFTPAIPFFSKPLAVMPTSAAPTTTSFTPSEVTPPLPTASIPAFLPSLLWPHHQFTNGVFLPHRPIPTCRQHKSIPLLPC